MTSQLNPEQARRLLTPVGDVSVEDVRVAATINDVFKVVTRSHGTFYIKFHTARWYADQPDTSFVAEREAAVHELLRKRGMPLPYEAWADTSRSVVSRSVFICGELPGIPITEALARFPQDASEIVRSLARYLRRLHEIEFSNPGILGPEHARAANERGPIPRVEAWDQHEMHRPEHFQRAALDLLADVTVRGLLSAEVTAALERLFHQSAATIAADYAPPRFTVGNCHAWHFHVEHSAEAWPVRGFYDFEAASAGDPTIDLVEIEVTLTPDMRSFRWREPFFEGYGSTPAFEGYKMRVLYYLLSQVGRSGTRQVPDQAWLQGQWLNLIHAPDCEQLAWFPVRD